jgi:Flp pilus assembly protein TadG
VVFAKRLRNDSDGVILPYVAITLGVIIGLAALALDGSRLMSLQTQLQSGADALALAGAAELDRRPDSIIRAEAAIRNLLANPVVGAGIGQTAQVSSIEFLRSLPPQDDLPITTANLTNDPTLAAYVQVSVKPIAMQPVFPVSLTSNNSSIAVQAQAVAGYDQIVCDVAPVFVCNPFENSGMTYYQATQALIAADQNPAGDSRLIRLSRSQAKNGGLSAGDFGYLNPATGYLPVGACGPGGNNGIPQALAATQVQACFRLSRVSPLPSNDQSAMDALNTRFDIYANGFKSCRLYPPDLNVRKGFTALNNVDWCNNAVPAGTQWPMPTPAAAALPIDQNMLRSAAAFDPNVNLGSGTWNCAAYWGTAHAFGTGKDFPPTGCSEATSISRYQVYRYELNFLNDRSIGAEYGAPQCVRRGVPDRRIITAAIVNCGSSPVPVLSDAPNIPVAAFGRFFLVLPAENGTNGNPYAEFLGLVKRSDPLSTDMVQLNR